MAKAATPAASAASAAASASPSAPASFESALAELETLVKSLEGGANGPDALPLEDSLAAYQRGMSLLRYCQDALLAAEQKIQILEKDSLRDFKPDAEE